MAFWIESWQSLARHPKMKRAARRLGITRATMIGHLHLMWWWAVDYAPNGIIADTDADELADEADWHGDPDQFVDALCHAGLLEPVDGGWWIHDWHEHAGKATRMARESAAEQGRYGAHIRYHVNAKTKRDGCPWCRGEPPPDIAPLKPPYKGGYKGPIATGPTEPTEQNRQDRQKPLVSTDVDTPAALALVVEHADTQTPTLDDLRAAYPRNPDNGKPWGGGTRAETNDQWRRLSGADKHAAIVGATHYAAACDRPDAANPKHAHRWLKLKAWEDWQTPARPTANGRLAEMPRSVREAVAYDHALEQFAQGDPQ